jgi:hypothetical protein
MAMAMGQGRLRVQANSPAFSRLVALLSAGAPRTQVGFRPGPVRATPIERLIGTTGTRLRPGPVRAPAARRLNLPPGAGWQ